MNTSTKMLKKSESDAATKNFTTKLVSKISNLAIENELLTFPNQPIIWSLVDNSKQGRIYKLNGGKAVIIIGNFEKPLIFIAGDLDRAAFESALSLCPDDAFIYCQPLYHKWFLKIGWQVLSRVQLTYSNALPIALKESMTIKPIDNLELFKQCAWFEKIGERYYGNPQNFFSHGEGYALFNKDQIAAEVYSAFISRDYVEIGIVTHPDFRQQQYAAILSSYYVEKIHKEGKTPIWSCRTSNLGSLKTALKIGFEIDQYYIQLIKNQ